MIAIEARPGSTQPILGAAPEPRPLASGEVLCRTLELGICGTDREILNSAHPMTPPGENRLILGHECLARVEGVGSDTDSDLVGKLVVPVVRRPLPAADPFRVDMLAMGQYTERGIVEEHGFSTPTWIDRPEYLFRVKESIADLAILAEPLAVSEKGLNEAFLLQQARLGERIWVEPPPRVLVTGMGPIAFTAVIGAIARGWPVTMYGRDEPDSFRAQLAQEFGATYVQEGKFNFKPDHVERDGYDLIMECTGADSVLERCCYVAASRGVLVWLGSIPRKEPKPCRLDEMMKLCFLRNHLHVGTVNAAPRDFLDALAHLEKLKASHPEQMLKLFTGRVRPEDSISHYVDRQPQSIKTVVMYS